jgi:hypothetical protein
MTTDPSSIQLDDWLFRPIAEGVLPLAEANRAFHFLALRLGEALRCELRVCEPQTDVSPGSASAIFEPTSSAYGPLSISLHVKASILITDEDATIDALVFVFSGETRLKGPGCDYFRFVYDRSTDVWRFVGSEEDAYEEWTDV